MTKIRGINASIYNCKIPFLSFFGFVFFTILISFFMSASFLWIHSTYLTVLSQEAFLCIMFYFCIIQFVIYSFLDVLILYLYFMLNFVLYFLYFLSYYLILFIYFFICSSFRFIHFLTIDCVLTSYNNKPQRNIHLYTAAVPYYPIITSLIRLSGIVRRLISLPSS